MDGAVYTVSGDAARCGYPQAEKRRNPNVYISLLTLSGHLRTLAALPRTRPREGRFCNRIWPRLRGSGKGHETHLPAQHIKARTHARFPCPYGDQGRPPDTQAPPRQGPRPAHAVRRSAPVATTSNDPGLTGGSGNRFRKNNRLLDAADFGRVFKQAKRSRDPLFTVLCRRNKSNPARLGLAISKKHCRQAVGRNRIKRLVRESFRRNQALLTGLDIVVINQPAASRASNPEIVASLERHWRRCSESPTQGPHANG